MKLAIIPARGGSRRIPRKNIRDFLGKPIIGYSIEAAQKCGLFDHIVVSTDDAEIADVARRFGAEVPFMRPAPLADDHTGTAAVVKHALQMLDKTAQPAEFACCIYATAPFVTPQDLQAGFELLLTTRKDYAFSVASFGFPIQRASQTRSGHRRGPFDRSRHHERDDRLHPDCARWRCSDRNDHDRKTTGVLRPRLRRHRTVRDFP